MRHYATPLLPPDTYQNRLPLMLHFILLLLCFHASTPPLLALVCHRLRVQPDARVNTLK